MDIDDLVIIGKLGFNHKNKDWINFKLNDEFCEYIDEIDELFLIFKDHRVRYVKVKRLAKRDNKLYFRLEDSDIYEELINQSDILIGLDPETIDKWEESEGYYDPLGMEVFYQDELIGKVIDWFNNGAQDVFVIELNNGKEIMIPEVEEFIDRIDTEKKWIYTKAIDDFLEL